MPNEFLKEYYKAHASELQKADGMWNGDKSGGNRVNKYSDSLAKATLENGGMLTKKQVQGLAGYGANSYKAYQTWYSKNYDFFNNYDHSGAEMSNLKNQLGLFTNESDTGYQSYLSALDELSASQFASEQQELSRAENDMYRSIGTAQRQYERDIAKRRQQALKSGMSTAQLAAQEQQNILAAQTGAQTLARQYNDQRYQLVNQYASANQQNRVNALQQSLTNAGAMSTAYAQMYAADKYDQNK